MISGREHRTYKPVGSNHRRQNPKIRPVEVTSPHDSPADTINTATLSVRSSRAAVLLQMLDPVGRILPSGTRGSIICFSKMNLTCFTSADPAAHTVSMVYDRTVDDGHFWAREDPMIPLPPCPGSSASQCSVCMDQLVSVVCRNLTTGVKFFMEGPGGSISFNETVCPQLPSPITVPAPSRHHLPAIIPATLCLLFIILILIIKKTSGSRKFRAALRCCFKQNQEEKEGSGASDMKPINV